MIFYIQSRLLIFLQLGALEGLCGRLRILVEWEHRTGALLMLGAKCAVPWPILFGGVMPNATSYGK